MKGKVSIFLMVSLVVSLCALTTLAQSEEQKAQLYFVEEVVVKPSMIDKYEELTKEALDLWTKYGSPFLFYAFVTDDFHYYFVWPIENYASLDSLFKAIGDWVVKMGDENWQALMKSGEGTYGYMKWSIVRHKPDLSYSPEKPRLKPEEANFIYIGLCYVKPGKDKEFDEAFKKWVDLYKNNNITDGFDTFAGDIGTEMPFYFWTFRAKSASDFWIHSKVRNKKIGEEKVRTLHHKTVALFRKIEFKTGRFRPGFSYIPKEK